MKHLTVSGLVAFVLFSSACFAELKELDDKKLEDQKAKAGITIDLESQLHIGEVYWDPRNSGNKEKLRRNYMPQQVDAITYDIDGGKK